MKNDQTLQVTHDSRLSIYFRSVDDIYTWWAGPDSLREKIFANKFWHFARFNNNEYPIRRNDELYELYVDIDKVQRMKRQWLHWQYLSSEWMKVLQLWKHFMQYSLVEAEEGWDLRYVGRIGGKRPMFTLYFQQRREGTNGALLLIRLLWHNWWMEALWKMTVTSLEPNQFQYNRQSCFELLFWLLG